MSWQEQRTIRTPEAIATKKPAEVNTFVLARDEKELLKKRML